MEKKHKDHITTQRSSGYRAARRWITDALAQLAKLLGVHGKKGTSWLGLLLKIVQVILQVMSRKK